MVKPINEDEPRKDAESDQLTPDELGEVTGGSGGTKHYWCDGYGVPHSGPGTDVYPWSWNGVACVK